MTTCAVALNHPQRTDAYDKELDDSVESMNRAHATTAALENCAESERDGMITPPPMAPRTEPPPLNRKRVR